MKILREFGGRALLLSVSLLAYLGLWGFLCFSSAVDVLAENEDTRIFQTYRETAAEMLNASDAEKAAWLRSARGKGEAWRKNLKVNRHYWGTVPAGGDRTLVWIMAEETTSDAEAVYVRETAALKPTDFRAIVRWGGLGLFVLLALSTGAGIASAYAYAKSRDDFMAAAVHDLNTPLVGLRFMIGRDDDEARALNERLVRLVANVKDFLRLGGRRKKPDARPVDLRKAYDEAYALFREDFRDAFDGADVAVDAPAGLPSVAADELLVVQIVWNLLGNELKYAAPYGPVAASFAVRGRFVELAFKDEGQGLSPREMKRVFKRYYRARRGMESGKGGFGIGLCTSREFARAMGGDLTVRANAPHGCVFTLALPIAAS